MAAHWRDSPRNPLEIGFGGNVDDAEARDLVSEPARHVDGLRMLRPAQAAQ